MLRTDSGSGLLCHVESLEISDRKWKRIEFFVAFSGSTKVPE